MEQGLASDLASANDLGRFVAACRDAVAASRWLTYDPSRLAALEGVVRAARPCGWDWYLREPGGPLESRWYDIVFTSAMNGGYFERGADGRVRQWERRGSGSVAMLDWVGALRERRLLPGVDFASLPGGGLVRLDGGAWPGVALADDGSDPRAAIDATMEEAGASYRPWRRAVVEEFAGHLARPASEVVRAFLRRGGDGRWAGTLDVGHARVLAALLPVSFGGDPFLKKALLALLILVGHLRAHGHPVEARIPIPSDYQMPRILSWAGAIRPGADLEALLRSGFLVDPASEAVAHYRAAAVVAAHDLGAATGAPDWLVDGALFGVVRNDEAFKSGSLPPMRIDGTWF
jgi:hypothetical protein